MKTIFVFLTSLFIISISFLGCRAFPVTAPAKDLYPKTNSVIIKNIDKSDKWLSDFKIYEFYIGYIEIGHCYIGLILNPIEFNKKVNLLKHVNTINLNILIEGKVITVKPICINTNELNDSLINKKPYVVFLDLLTRNFDLKKCSFSLESAGIK